MSNGSTSIVKLIMVPSLITLAVTIIRLVGELNHWNETLFSRAAGGGNAVVGIVWLAFIFAIYFAVKVQNSGDNPSSAGKAIGLTLLAFAVFVGGEFLALKGGKEESAPIMLTGLVLVIAAILIMRIGWPGYWKVMIAYALAARIPVTIIMFLGLRGAWGTHYDAVPPDFKSPDLMTRFVQLALIPQLTFWIAFTVILCGLFGVVVASVRKGRT